MKRIGILTRDCAGINAAIRAVVRTATSHNIEVKGILRGYDGLIKGELKELDRRSVSGVLNKGGTILKTARSQGFYTQEGQEKAQKTIQKNNLDGLVIIGGDGSIKGAHVLSSQYHVPVMCIPATIDNDINGVDLAIGANTAVNVALDALDKIRDTASSLERIFVVEVMGRNYGYIALQVALAGGCEEVLIPEKDIDLERMCTEITRGSRNGKKSWIIIVAEGKAKATDIAETVIQKTGLETRVTVLGYIQRGGVPTVLDRIMAAKLGNYAVELLREGETGQCVRLKDRKLGTIPLQTAVQPKSLEWEAQYRLIKLLT